MRMPWSKSQRQQEIATANANLELALWRVAETVASQLQADMAADALGWTSLADLVVTGHDLSWTDLKDVRAKLLRQWMIDPTIGQVSNLLASGTLGRGVQTPVAADDGVQQIVDRFWDDADNQLALFSYEAQVLTNTLLLIDGERFLTLHYTDADDEVKLADIPADEIRDVITHPQNRRRPVLYHRVYLPAAWSVKDKAYKAATKEISKYYLDWRYVHQLDPEKDKDVAALIESVGSALVENVAIYHIKTNTVGLRGVPELYRSYDPAKSHASALDDLGTMTKALAMFAWTVKVKSQSAAAVKAAAEQYIDPVPGPGAVRVGNEASTLDPVNVGTGVTSNQSVTVRQTFLNAIRSHGFGEHWYGDATSGNLAIGESMEVPAIWRIESRQELFEQVFNDLAQFAIVRVQVGGKTVRLASGVDTTLDIDFPPARPAVPSETAALLISLVQAIAGGLIDPQEAAYQAYLALGSNNIQELLERQFAVERSGAEAASAVPLSDAEQAEVERRVAETLEPLLRDLEGN